MLVIVEMMSGTETALYSMIALSSVCLTKKTRILSLRIYAQNVEGPPSLVDTVTVNRFFGRRAR